MAKTLGLAELLGPPCKERDIAYALILARVVHPRPKLATTKWWGDTTLVADLGLEGDLAPTRSMRPWTGWGNVKAPIEAKLATAPSRWQRPIPLAWPTSICPLRGWKGPKNELAARGYSRDKKRGMAQIEYGLLTDKDGRPVAIEVFPGNTADPTAFISMVETIRNRFGLERLTMVGDRGMITSARITALARSGRPRVVDLPAGSPDRRLGQRRRTLATRPVRPERPGRVLPPRLPRRTADRLSQSLAGRRTQAQAQRALGRHRGGPRPDRRFGARRTPRRRRQDRAQSRQGDQQVQDGQALRGLHWREHAGHVPDKRTPSPPRPPSTGSTCCAPPSKTTDLDAPGVVDAYKALSHVERDFRHLKVDDIDLRPIHHRLEARVRSHVFICMLAAYLVWHLREALAPLTFTDEAATAARQPGRPGRAFGRRPGPRRRPKSTQTAKRSAGFRELLEHLGTPDPQHHADDDGDHQRVRAPGHTDPHPAPGLRTARRTGAPQALVASPCAPCGGVT